MNCRGFPGRMSGPWSVNGSTGESWTVSPGLMPGENHADEAMHLGPAQVLVAPLRRKLLRVVDRRMREHEPECRVARGRGHEGREIRFRREPEAPVGYGEIPHAGREAVHREPPGVGPEVAIEEDLDEVRVEDECVPVAGPLADHGRGLPELLATLRRGRVP